MPELPDIELYLHALGPRLVGRQIVALRIASPFVVRSTTPDPQRLVGRTITGLHRLGKRIAIDADGVFMVVHLMVAGRFQWRPEGAPIPKRLGLLALDVEGGCLVLTEAGTTRRAAVHLAEGADTLQRMAQGGLEVLEASAPEFLDALGRERHTLKRSLTDPALFSGIGNAYSDEILHHARLSPLRMSDSLSAEESRRLYTSTRTVLAEWRERLIAEAGDTFPTKVTAFRAGMAVHGRYGLPCPRCQTPVQRLRYAANEANYCPACQTDGRLLADRGLSRLLKADWPRTLEALERRKAAQRIPGVE